MNKDDFIQAWGDVKPPPCRTCIYEVHCRDEREACELFRKYCDPTDRNFPNKKHYLQVPSAKFYNDLFTDFVEYDPERHGE